MRIKNKALTTAEPTQGVFCSDGCDLQLKKTGTRIALVLLLQMGLIQAFGVIIGILQSLFEEVFVEIAACIIGEAVYGIGYFLCFTVPAWIFCIGAKKKGTYCKAFYRGRLPRTMPLIVFGVIAINFAAAYVNSYVMTAIFPGLNGMMVVMENDPMTWYGTLMSIFTVAIVPAICEEILFRGVILSHLLPYGRTVAIMGSGLLFGLMHGNPLQFFYTALLGVVLGYVYVKTQSLAVCMVLHFVNNGLSILQSALYGQSALMSGIAIGIEFGVIVVGAISILILCCREKKKPHPEDVGCFGVIHEPHADFAVCPVTPAKRIRLFFSPAMIIYVVLSVLTMALLAFVFGMAYFIG